MCFRLYKVLEVPVYIQSGEEKYKTGLQLGKFKQVYLITVSGSFSSIFHFFLRIERESSFPFIPASSRSSYPVILAILRSSDCLYCTPVPRRLFFTALQWIANAQGPKIQQKNEL
jgi:hypothetical protein